MKDFFSAITGFVYAGSVLRMGAHNAYLVLNTGLPIEERITSTLTRIRTTPDGERVTMEHPKYTRIYKRMMYRGLPIVSTHDLKLQTENTIAMMLYMRGNVSRTVYHLHLPYTPVELEHVAMHIHRITTIPFDRKHHNVLVSRKVEDIFRLIDSYKQTWM